MKLRNACWLPLLLLALAPALMASDCDPETEDTLWLWAVSGPPPARTAELRTWPEEDRRLRLSMGVAFAVHCSDSCEGPCFEPVFEVDPPRLATVRPAYRHGSDGGDFVIVGAEAGAGAITVATTCARLVIPLEVLPSGD